MQQVDVKAAGSDRWWEFYAVRYAMGTVIGGVIFFFLCSTNPVLKSLLFGANVGNLNGPLLVLLGAYGLTYCYFASAPVLVLHAGRFFMSTQFMARKFVRHILVMFVVPVLLALAFFCETRTVGSTRWLYTIVFFLGALILWLQYVMVGVTLWYNRDLYNFYRSLASRREAQFGGIVSSYRHLREHGNSFFIVLCELVLAVLLYIYGNFSTTMSNVPLSQGDKYVTPYLLIMLLWIIPAAVVWVVANLLERRFSGILP